MQRRSVTRVLAHGTSHARHSSVSFLARRPLAALVPVIVGVISAGAHAAPPLPAGGAFVAGSGSIATGAQSVTVGQTSTRGVITWNSFDIGAGKTVSIDNGTGATLNRVTGGGGASSILGALNATGSVYLINPQGVVIGTSGVVTTGGRFVASALDVTNAAFMRGGALTFASGGDGAVVNLGRIGSSGGDVFLIARSTVSNQGTINAPKGTAELAAGSQVLLQDSASGQQVFVNAGSGGTVSNAGAINAAQASLQAADGNVYALAGNTSAIRATGTATRDGHVWLVANKGHVQIHDSVTATNANGTGGTVDSSGTTLNIGASTVTAGQWNFTVPVSYSIDQTTASALSASLNKGTSVNVAANGNGSSIALNGAIDWNSAATLTLAAGRNVGIARTGSISNTNAGDLVLRADSGSVDNGASVVNLGKIDWSKSTGLVSALYDMNGSFTPGTLLSNKAWRAQPYSGEVTQITAYKLVDNTPDLQKVWNDLAGNYALGRDFTVSPMSPVGTDGTPFNGQFDGFGHSLTINAVSSYLSPSCQCAFGGLFGVIGANGVVRNIDVSGSSTNANSTAAALGMLAGENFGTIAYATSSGHVGGSNDNYNGGLVGVNLGLIERSSSSADAGSAGDSGGLVYSNYGTIVQSYATGSATGYRVGGLAVYNGGVISQSYSTAVATSVAGASGSPVRSSAGGLVNENGPGGVIGESFATGAAISAPAASAQTAGIAVGNEGTIASNVYWNTQTTRQANAVVTNTGTPVPNANGLTTAQTSRQASFGGYDFSADGVWAMPAGATHPVLQWQMTKQ